MIVTVAHSKVEEKSKFFGDWKKDVLIRINKKCLKKEIWKK
jgi:hypothetical protein